ncbi:hypothetical protein [Diplocloster agilis]|uniref:hypothetical protein n=1 Tax=Diplocloster agilis TaxID=2850323 RepID=UPI000821C0CE|nr:hypothetical protein [Suonthocola fibrivorans]MCU6734923.1 hypothetical protein [Suonthocola fibrivorans]SCJ59024.1 Uncharacterised protein [uncultured Clostridium sp.]
MKLKEYAAEFGLTVNELSTLTGYSRMALNEILKGNSQKESIQRRDARRNLSKYAIDCCADQIDAAQKTRDKRIKLIELI